MRSSGPMAEPSRRTLTVFCHIWPNPWTGPATRRPVTVSMPAVVAVVASRSTGWAHASGSRGAFGCVAVMAGLLVPGQGQSTDGRDRGFGGVVDGDCLVEAGQRQDLAVVLVQPDGEEPLAPTLDP